MATLTPRTAGGAKNGTHTPGIRATLGGAPPGAPGRTGDAAARRALRLQIARLERELAQTVEVDGLPLAPGPAAHAPQLLTLGQLESARDELVNQLGERRQVLDRRAAIHAANRELLERMLLEPRRHKFARVSQADIGAFGCGSWHVQPRLGVIGMLAGWWHVKLSSGCPSPARLAAASE